MKVSPNLQAAVDRWSQRNDGVAPESLDELGRQTMVQDLAQDPALASLTRIEIVRALEASFFEPTPTSLAALVGGAPPASSAAKQASVAGSTVLGARLGTAAVGPRELDTLDDVLRFASGFDDGVLMVGFGSKNQFADPAAVRAQVDELVARQNEKFGEGRWFATFGGDPLNEDKPDVAIVAQRLIELGVPTLAVQSDVVKNEWGGVDKHIPFVHYVPTDRDDDGKIQWGGRDDAGDLLGPSKVYLGPLAEHLGALALFGGGDIAVEEARHAKELGLSVIDCPAEALNPTGELCGASAVLFPDHEPGRVYWDR